MKLQQPFGTPQSTAAQQFFGGQQPTPMQQPAMQQAVMPTLEVPQQPAAQPVPQPAFQDTSMQPADAPAASPQQNSFLNLSDPMQQIQQPQQQAPAEETCLYCGTKYFKGVKYCPGCGVSLPEFSADDFFR